MMRVSIFEDIKGKYKDYRLGKIDRLARALNERPDRIQASPSSPVAIQPDKLKITIKTLPAQISIAEAAELALKSAGTNPASPGETADQSFLREFEAYACSLGITRIGYTDILPEYVFKGRSVPYTHAIVLIAEIPKEPIDRAPSDETQAIGLISYQQTGNATNVLAGYLRKHGFAAEAGHPAIGPALYPRMALKAGLGNGGRHGMLISPEFGPRQRISAIFTSIANLPATDSDEYAWTREFCASCGNCVRKCPAKAILEQPIVHPDGRISHVDGDRCISCTICMKECSFNKRGYWAIKQAYLKRKNS